jgi:hypothetical protein
VFFLNTTQVFEVSFDPYRLKTLNPKRRRTKKKNSKKKKKKLDSFFDAPYLKNDSRARAKHSSLRRFARCCSLSGERERESPLSLSLLLSFFNARKKRERRKSFLLINSFGKDEIDVETRTERTVETMERISSR